MAFLGWLVMAKSHHGVSKQVLIRIGEVAVEWSALEYAIQLSIGILLGIENDAITFAVTPRASLGSWTDMLANISRIQNHAQAAQIAKLASDIAETYKKRNIAIHSNWMGIFAPTVYPGRKTPWPKHMHTWALGPAIPRRGKKTWLLELTSPENLDKTIDEIRVLHERLRKIFFPKPKASRRKPASASS